MADAKRKARTNIDAGAAGRPKAKGPMEGYRSSKKPIPRGRPTGYKRTKAHRAPGR